MKQNKDLQLPLSLTLAGLLAVTATLAGADSPRIELDRDRDAGEIAVGIRGEHFTTYHYGENARTPYLWPVKAEGGVGVTRNHPMGTDEPESADHPHHRSLFLTFGDVNGYDHWHNERIETRHIETGRTDDYARIRAGNEWLNSDGEPLLREVQEIRFYDTPASARYIDIVSTLEAAYGDVTFGDDKEGLLAFRIRPEIQGDRAGILTNAEGERGESNVYGKPSPWMDYSGSIEGHGTRGIAVFDHPGNFRHPTLWHVRDYGLAAANPFGLQSVGGLDTDGSHVLAEGDSMTFVYRVYVHSGDVDEAGVAEEYDRFAETEHR